MINFHILFQCGSIKRKITFKSILYPYIKQLWLRIESDNMEQYHNKFTQLVMDVHDCLCNDDIIKAIRTKKKINRLFNRIMNIERSEESIKLMDDLFKLETDLSMLIISELRRELYVPCCLGSPPGLETSDDSG